MEVSLTWFSGLWRCSEYVRPCVSQLAVSASAWRSLASSTCCGGLLHAATAIAAVAARDKGGTVWSTFHIGWTLGKTIVPPNASR